MPTLFSRRYMRGQPKSTEKWVGAVVLVPTGVIVVAFLLTGGLLQGFVNKHPILVRAKNAFGISETPLFTPDPENLPQPSPPREVRVAESLLPESPGADQPTGDAVRVFSLRSDTDATAARDAGLDPSWVEAVHEAGARWIFARQYGPDKTTATWARIADMGDVAAAIKVFEARKPEDSHPLAVGRRGWVNQRAAGFWSGRYYTEVSAANPQGPATEVLARTLASMQLPYGGPSIEPATALVEPDGGAVPAGTPAAGTARFAEVPGGRLVAPTRIDRYAENMYEKINGKESAFRAFSVVDLKFGQYADPQAQRAYDAYVYDMAEPINAMGMYMSERSPSAAAFDVGREGYVSGTSVFYWKGQYYVNVLGPPEGGEPELNAAKQIAAAIADTIADSGEPFWADKLLPSEDRVPNSFSYQATSALGYEFLQRMFFARYEVAGKKLQMYLTKATDAEAAKSLYSRFAEATARYDKELSREPLAGGELFVYETPMPGRPSKYGAAFSKGPYFGGVYEAEEQDLAVSRAKALFESLSANDPGDPQAASPVSTPPAEEAAEDSEAQGEDGEGEHGEGEGEYGEAESQGGESGY